MALERRPWVYSSMPNLALIGLGVWVVHKPPKFPKLLIFMWLCVVIYNSTKYMPIKVKFGMEEYTIGLHLCAKFGPDRDGVGTEAPKLENLVKLRFSVVFRAYRLFPTHFLSLPFLFSVPISYLSHPSLSFSLPFFPFPFLFLRFFLAFPYLSFPCLPFPHFPTRSSPYFLLPSLFFWQ